MKSILSKFILAPAVLAAAVLATNSANAETTRVRVPFQFTAAGKVCPAGYYKVARDPNSNFVALIGQDSSEIFTWTVGPGTPDPTDRKISLTFDQVGGAHVLQSIQYGNVITARLDKKSIRDMERDSNRLTGGR